MNIQGKQNKWCASLRICSKLTNNKVTPKEKTTCSLIIWLKHACLFVYWQYIDAFYYGEKTYQGKSHSNQL